MKHNIIRTLVFASTAALATLTFSSPASAQRRWLDGGGITVYSDIDFRGDSARFRGDVPDLVRVGLNDTISSIQIANGETWQICQDVNFGGRCQLISGSIADLRRMNWNDRISSMRRVDTGYYRDSRESGENDGYYNNSRNGGYYRNGYNNDGVVVFMNPNFRGSNAVFTNDVPNLVPYGLNDRISSIQI